MKINRIMLLIMVTAMASLICLHGKASQAGDSSVPTDFATIQDAIDDVGTVAGDTITVEAGTHTESNIQINKAVTIAGVGTGSTILDPSSTVIVFRLNVDGITIKDLTVQNASQAIRFEKAGGTIDNTEINNVEFLNNSFFGIGIHDNTTVTDLRVIDCHFDNNNLGIFMASSAVADGISITGSTFENHSLGFAQANLGSTGHLLDLHVDDCTFNNNSFAAVYVEEVRDVKVYNSTFTDNRRGFYLFRVNWVIQTGDISIHDNTFTDSALAAVLIDVDTLDLPVTIEDNIINADVGVLESGRGQQIDFRLSTFFTHAPVTVIGNTVSFFGSFGAGVTAAYAVMMRGDFDGVTITGNRFQGGSVGDNGGVPPSSGIYVLTDEPDGFWGTATPSSVATVYGCNRITGFVNGVSAYNLASGAWGGLPTGAQFNVNNNDISGNSGFGVQNDDGTGTSTSETIDATNNWWGTFDGPSGVGSGTGDAVSANVDFSPWSTATCLANVVDIDIKPRRCPNKLMVKKKGKDDDSSDDESSDDSGGKKRKGDCKVAILGTEDFEVSTIDIDTIRLNGVVAPVKSKFKDVTAPSALPSGLPDCNCEKLGKDTYKDLVLKFNSQDILDTLGTVQDGDVIELTLTGNLLDGTPIVGKDCVVIKIKGKDDDSS